MRLLFTLDAKDYYDTKTRVVRNSSRAIIIENKKVAMVYSSKYDYYKFPGGGIEENESKIDTLIRETKEETGLEIIKDSIKEYGYVYRIQKSADKDATFIQDNYYYICNVEKERSAQSLDDYEANEGFTLQYVDPIEVIKVNRQNTSDKIVKLMIEREAKVLELLIDEGYFS